MDWSNHKFPCGQKDAGTWEKYLGFSFRVIRCYHCNKPLIIWTKSGRKIYKYIPKYCKKRTEWIRNPNSSALVYLKKNNL